MEIHTSIANEANGVDGSDIHHRLGIDTHDNDDIYNNSSTTSNGGSTPHIRQDVSPSLIPIQQPLSPLLLSTTAAKHNNNTNGSLIAIGCGANKNLLRRWILFNCVLLPIIFYVVHHYLLGNIPTQISKSHDFELVLHIYRSMWSILLLFALTLMNLLVWKYYGIDYISIFKLQDYFQEDEHHNHFQINQFEKEHKHQQTQQHQQQQQQQQQKDIFIEAFSKTLFYLFFILIATILFDEQTKTVTKTTHQFNLTGLSILWLIFFSIILYNKIIRKLLVSSISGILKTPFKSVSFLSFWVADQITSLSLFLKDFSFSLCFIISFNNLEVCVYQSHWLTPLLFSTPFIFRICQCLKIYYDTRNTTQLYNAFKYLLSLIVLFFSIMYHYYSIYYRPYWICFAITSTFYSYIWDIKKDWGLLDRKSKNYLLRDNLIYNDKYFYYFAMISNLIMRFSWVVAADPEIFGLHSTLDILGIFLISIEIIRRGQWNFLRLEYQHIVEQSIDYHTV
ncbi:hypothetical protein CYY_000947 [Polysphondylium violaceum]|uniref:EXS domain-containing protein n=1 Tax=Polysphondylium violaceum TaxID=133409 RepID=A0A8J4V210_9MYCE|nr:hypothetical protein CYY_000947 [Polysphondylium violaceum]